MKHLKYLVNIIDVHSIDLDNEVVHYTIDWNQQVREGDEYLARLLIDHTALLMFEADLDVTPESINKEFVKLCDYITGDNLIGSQYVDERSVEEQLFDEMNDSLLSELSTVA